MYEALSGDVVGRGPRCRPFRPRIRSGGRDWARVSEALGKSGTVMPGGIYRVALPRTDLKATLDGVALKPAFALGGRVAFAKMGRDAVVMGDLVLTQSEVNPVMSRLFDSGIEVTALYNHLPRNRPFTMYLHVFGEGDPVKLATALRGALAESRTPLSAAASGSPQPAAPPALDTAAIDHILGAKGKNAGGVYQFSIPRAEPITLSAFGWPLLIGGAIKGVYDILLLVKFPKVRPPEEAGAVGN